MRGVDKLLQEVDRIPLLRRQVLVAKATGQPVFVALPTLDHPRAAVIGDLDVQLLAVPDWADGMSASLRGAVAQLPICAAFMVLLADLVAITSGDLAAVLTARDNHPDKLIWRGATSDGKPGHPIVFASQLRPEFAGLTGDTGGEPIAKANRDLTCLVPLPDQRARLDLDTPEAWDAWRKTTL